MKKILSVVATLAAVSFSSQALACKDLDAAMARFNQVKDAFIPKAATFSPAQIQVWSENVQAFGDKMGKMDFPGACQSLDVIAIELNLGGAAAAPAVAAPTPQPQPQPPRQRDRP